MHSGYSIDIRRNFTPKSRNMPSSNSLLAVHKNIHATKEEFSGGGDEKAEGCNLGHLQVEWSQLFYALWAASQVTKQNPNDSEAVQMHNQVVNIHFFVQMPHMLDSD